jgi:hypothetical protein
MAYLSVSFLDLIHTLAYKGMGVFPGFDANLPTQLWIAARLCSKTVFAGSPRSFFVENCMFLNGEKTALEFLPNRVDQALYSAKQAGQNQIHSA